MKNIAFLIFLLFFSCGRSSNEKEQNQAITIDSLQNEIRQLKEANDTLSEHLMTKAYMTRNYPAYFDTIPEPDAHILNELQKNSNLIPEDAVLGGTMRFTRINFINDDLLIAEYEDGHVMGEAIYSYNMDRNGNLGFQLVATVE